METTTNLRRDSGEGAAKKMCPEKSQPEAGPSPQTQPQLPPPSLPSPSTLPPPPFPLQKYHYSLLLNKWTLFHPFHPNRNITFKNTTVLIKSPSLDPNQLKGRNPRAKLEPHPSPHSAPQTYHPRNYSLQFPHQKENLTLLPEKRNQIGRRMNF